MGLFDDIAGGVRKLILLEEKIDRLVDGVDRMRGDVDDHEKRLIRIETTIEIARARRLERGGG